jgi:hypothetical protein
MLSAYGFSTPHCHSPFTQPLHYPPHLSTHPIQPFTPHSNHSYASKFSLTRMEGESEVSRLRERLARREDELRQSAGVVDELGRRVTQLQAKLDEEVRARADVESRNADLST